MNWTEIALGLMTLLAACGWFTKGWRMHRKETEARAIENDTEKMNLSKQYVDEFKENIVKPLQSEIKGLRRDVKNLQKAVDRISDCAYADSCPVRAELQKQADDDEGGK